MHPYSLRFNNQVLEEKYQRYQNKQCLTHIVNILRLNYLTLVLLAIICLVMANYVSLGLSSYCILTNFALQRRITQMSEQQVIWTYESFVLCSPPFMLIAIYFSNDQQAMGINMLVWLIIQVQILVITPNILLAAIECLNFFIAIFIIIYFVFGYALYIFTWMPLFCFCMYNFYCQKRYQRLLFQESQVNESIFTLIKDTSIDDFMYFKLNRELLQYELEFTNIENPDLSSFLSSIMIDRNQNIKQYLFSKININNLASDKHKVIGYKNLKEKVELEIYIQHYPELKFYIRILTISHEKHAYPEQESKIMHSFYQEIIKKVKSNPKSVNWKSILGILCSLNAKIQFERISQAPHKFQQSTQFSILNVLKSCCKNLGIKVYLNDNDRAQCTVNSNRIIFQTLLYFLLKPIKSKNTKVNASIITSNSLLSIKLNFENELNIRALNNSNYMKNILFLQDFLSQKQTLMKNSEFICFLDHEQCISFFRTT